MPRHDPGVPVEDCLTAEVWTPSLDAHNPVIVWVPGGSYRIGGASLPTYDGAGLAELSTVVVGVNYRLGALGWLAADGVPSNLGLRDLLAALTWVRDVAPAFGGDPDRIVVMGESAGAGMIADLLAAMPRIGTGVPVTVRRDRPERCRGRDTRRARLSSGSASSCWTPRECATRLHWRDLPLAAILDAQERTVDAALGKVGMMPFHPWIDGDLLDTPPFRAPLVDVPLVVGTNVVEMELFRDQVPALPEAVAVSFLARKASSLGIADEARVRYGLRVCDGDLVEAVADLDLHVPNELMARVDEQRGNPVWRYRFNGRHRCVARVSRARSAVHLRHPRRRRLA